MKDLLELLGGLRSAGVALSLNNNGDIEYRSRIKLSDEHKEQIWRNKAAIVALLQKDADGSPIPGFPVKAERPARIPLSFTQERLWVISQLEGVNDTYHIPLALRLQGSLNEGALWAALSALVARHEALRTVIRHDDVGPFQVVLDAIGGFESRSHNFPHEDATSERVRAFCAERISRPFDLAAGPLIRADLIRLADQNYILLIVVHHIVFDGWSQGILVDELSTLYKYFSTEGERSNGHPGLSEIPAQYADFALLQHDQWMAQILDEEGGFWRRILQGAPASLSLPVDFRAPARRNFRGGTVPVELDRVTTSKLSSLCKERGITLFMALIAGWAATLSRLSGNDDIMIGTPSANRPYVEIEGTIGLFVNMVPLRFKFPSHTTFSDILDQAASLVPTALSQAHLPFERFMEAVDPSRNLSHAPLFQVSFVWQNNHSGYFDLPGLALAGLDLPNETAKFDLTLVLGEVDGRISGGLEYASALFERATAERFAGYLSRILSSLAADPSLLVSRASILPTAERNRLLTRWNSTEVCFPSDRCVHELFEEQAALQPRSIALVCNETELSYGELDAQANRLAAHLRSIGVGPERIVAICTERSFEMIVGLLAILKAGGAYLPLDPDYPAKRLRYMMDDAAPIALLRHRATRTILEDVLSDSEMALPVVELDEVLEAWPPFTERNGDRGQRGLLQPRSTASSLVYVLYTSGSTGSPKGVQAVHRNVVRLVKGANYVELSPSETMLQLAPLAFDASTFEIWGALLNGAKLVIYPHQRVDLQQLAQTIDRHEVNTLWLTAGLFHSVVDQALWALRPVRQLLAGGDVLSPSRVQRLLTALPGCTLINGYGPTECVTFSLCNAAVRIPEPGASVSIGQPISNTRAYILDDCLEPVPRGAVGEIYIGGAGVARGYLNRPALTAERFVPSPFIKGERLYRTGDLARHLADGTVEFIGRNDFQVKIRGFRIELGEVEGCLCSHEMIRDAIVVIRGGENGDKKLVAFYCLAEGSDDIPVDRLRTHLASQLPGYMIPSAYARLDTMPLTANGKIDRQALPEVAPDASVQAMSEPPDGAVEEQVAQIWREVLGIEQISRHDDFFQLGGESLLAMRVLTKIREVIVTKIDLEDIFDYGTLHEIAARISEKVD